VEFPRAIAGALSEVRKEFLPNIPTDNVSCDGAKFHSPRPLLVMPVELPNGRDVYLCGVCRDNLRVLQELEKEHGSLSWAVRREFGNRLRSLTVREENDNG